MKKYILLVCLTSCFIGGIIFFCLHKEWLIVYWNRPLANKNGLSITHLKETVTIFLWKNNQWIEEKSVIMYENTETAKLEALSNAWLVCAYNQQLIPKKMKLESARISRSGTEGYLSFSEDFFYEDSTTQENYMLVESLLRTLDTKKLSCKEIMFLVHHRPLSNPFLDFSLPWPLK